DDEVTLRSDGQATSVLGVQRLFDPGPLTIADATALLAGRPGRRLVGPPASDALGGHPAVRLRAIEDTGPGQPLMLGLLVVQVGPERLVVTTATDDMTQAELDLVDGVALAPMLVRWLG
ncbi:MAG TPA: hypothetical protein VMM13_20800, partial [Euzebya sp.]|nr:hypothetical protein [Euzebya sp.]